MRTNLVTLSIAAMSTAVFAKPIISEGRSASSILAPEPFNSIISAVQSPAFTQAMSSANSEPLFTSTVSSVHGPVETDALSQIPSPLFTQVVSSAEPQPTAFESKSVDGKFSSELPAPVLSSVATSPISSAHTTSAIEGSVNATSTLLSHASRPTSFVNSVISETASYTSVISWNGTKLETTLHTSTVSSLPTPATSATLA
ncbi:unnamed protein product [Rhizoctonia solani]|uniref:Uncharacterized protein n=1 Tax=Rhizoctonia solani TaxID=456999 RepID=A0A8H2ZWK3_9AGAM|nr:unnamed protein product [Rhizoctonia solani]